MCNMVFESLLCLKILFCLLSTAAPRPLLFFTLTMYLRYEMRYLCLHIFKPLQQELHLSEGKESGNIGLSHCNKLFTLILNLWEEIKRTKSCHSDYVIMHFRLSPWLVWMISICYLLQLNSTEGKPWEKNVGCSPYKFLAKTVM